MPEDRGRARRHGPAYRPRARHGRRLLLRREPVQPRHPGAAPARLVVQAVRLFGGARQRLHAVVGGHGRADRDRYRQPASGSRRTTRQDSTGRDAAHRHRAVAQRHDRAPGAGHGHAARRRIRQALRHLRQAAALSVDGARRRRDDRAPHGRRPTP